MLKCVFISLSTFLGGELLGHIVILYLTFWGTAKIFSKTVAPFYIPTNDVWESKIFHIISNIGYYLSYYHHLLGVKWHFIVVLIYISTMANDVEHCFMCLSFIFIPSLEIHIFRSFAHFNRVIYFIFLLSSIIAFYIFWKQVLYQNMMQLYLYSVGCLAFLMISFEAPKF